MFSGGMKVDYLLKMSLKRIKSTCFNCTIFLNYGRTGNAPTTPCNPPISLIELWEFNRTKIENLSNEDIINAINQKPLLRYCNISWWMYYYWLNLASQLCYFPGLASCLQINVMLGIKRLELFADDFQL